MATLGKSSRCGSVFRGRTPSPIAAMRKNKVQLCIEQEAQDAQGGSHQPPLATLILAAPSARVWEVTIFCCLLCSDVCTPKQIHTADGLLLLSTDLTPLLEKHSLPQQYEQRRLRRSQPAHWGLWEHCYLFTSSCHTANQSLAPELAPQLPQGPIPAQPGLGLWHHFHAQLPEAKCFEGCNLRESSMDSLPSPMLFVWSLHLCSQVPLPWAAWEEALRDMKPGIGEGQGAWHHAWKDTMSMNRQPVHKVTVKQLRLGQARKPPGPGHRSCSSCQGGQEEKEKSTL